MPAGTLYIYFPYLFGALLAGFFDDRTRTLGSLSSMYLQLLCIAFLAHSIGCTWNDIVDCDFDRRVVRCRTRPIARGAVTVRQAILFMFAQYIVLFTLVACTSAQALPYFLPVVATGTFYPYAKRITDYAQLVLGISLACGVLVGNSVAGGNPLSLEYSVSNVAFASLATVYVFWTMIYDTIYAFQDLESDRKLGLKAMSVKYEHHAKPLLWSLVAGMIFLLGFTGFLMDASWVFYNGVILTTVILAIMVTRVNLKSPLECLWWFTYGSLMVGGTLTASLQGEHLYRLIALG